MRTEKFILSDFEKGIPPKAEVKHVRLDASRHVVFALGCDVEESVAIRWNAKGEAFVHLYTPKGQKVYAWVKKNKHKYVLGNVYYRCPEFDIAHKYEKEVLGA